MATCCKSNIIFLICAVLVVWCRPCRLHFLHLSRTRADPLAKWVSYFYADTFGVIHAISRSRCRPNLQIAVSREKSYWYCRSVTTPRRTALRKSLWHMAMCGRRRANVRAPTPSVGGRHSPWASENLLNRALLRTLAQNVSYRNRPSIFKFIWQ